MDTIKPLRILHLEDDPDYSELVESLLDAEQMGAQVVKVTGRAGFEAAVKREKFDVILADYLLPDFNGLEALRFARDQSPDTPFLLVSGTIGEQAAIESLQGGATDYVLKQWPERLVPAVRRAVEEAKERAERRRAELELRQNEEQYRLLFDGNPIPMWIFDHETLAFLETNEAASQHYGYSRAEFRTMKLSDLRPPEEAPALVEYLHKLLAKGTPTQFGVAGNWRHRKKDGSLIDVEVKWSPICFKGRSASLIMANDITERRRTEHRDATLSKLGQSLSSATSPAEAARIIKAVADDLFQGHVFTLDLYSAENEKVYPVLRVDTDRDGNSFEITSTGEGSDTSQWARRILEHGAELILRQEPLMMNEGTQPIGDASRPSGSLMGVLIRSRTKTIGILSIQSYWLNAYDQRDLSTLQTLADHCGGALERIRAEEALRRSDMLFHSVWQNSVDGMRLTDAEGKVAAINDAFCKLAGKTREELEGRLFSVVNAEPEREDRLREYQQRFRDGVSDKQAERKLTLHNGNVVNFEVSSSFVELRGRPRLLLEVFRDVTAQKRLEEQLRQSQKMEAIGQLAGGVAHDFNNILTVIHGHASLLLSAGGLTDDAARSARQITLAADRAAALTRQLLAFSRRQVMQPKQLDLNEVVSHMTEMLGRILGEDIALQLNYSPRPALVRADAGMMEQVLLNLAVNARDAMPTGGVLALKISVVDPDVRSSAQSRQTPAGRVVCVSVSDNGAGIAPENLGRLFEPFFTTKAVGKGTGLGLATVYGIVNQHQGWIEVKSQLGKGTTFDVFLPASHEPAEAAVSQPPEKPVRGGTETILVVEDEAPVRELVCSFLTRHGYRILQAESAVQALEVWGASKDKVDLLLTDLVMPDRINGRQLAERLWIERPKLKVIFTSGYSADVVGKDFVLQRGLNYLQKPYEPRKLALAVRDCLDALN